MENLTSSGMDLYKKKVMLVEKAGVLKDEGLPTFDGVLLILAEEILHPVL